MADTLDLPSPEVAAVYARYEQASESLVSAFQWATGTPDTREYGNWADLDDEMHVYIMSVLINKINSYARDELKLPTDLVQDCYLEAIEEQKN